MAKILIIDDSPVAAKMLKKSLENFDITCFYAPSGFEALGLRGFPSMLREVMPDAIFLDLVMPDMSGIDVLRKIKNRVDIQKTPVIMFSSKGEPQIIQEALGMGAIDFLAKPVYPDRLVESLWRVATVSRNEDLARCIWGGLGMSLRDKDIVEALCLDNVDLNLLYRLFDKDPEMLRQVAQSFEDAAESDLEIVARALESKNKTALRIQTCRIKESLINFGAWPVFFLVNDFLYLTQDEFYDKAKELFPNIEAGVLAVVKALKDWRRYGTKWIEEAAEKEAEKKA